MADASTTGASPEKGTSFFIELPRKTLADGETSRGER